MNIPMTRTRKIAYAAMLLAIYVLSVRLLGLLQPGPVFSFNRLGIGIAIIMFTSLLLGPFYGALVGVAGDALGWVILGQWTGAFNVFLSVYYAIVGILPHLLVKLAGKLLRKRYSLLAFGIGFGLAYGVLTILTWVPGVFDICFTRWNLDPTACRIFVTVLAGVLTAATIFGVFFINKKSRADVHMGEVAWASFAVELVTIFLKPLAFYLYCLAFLGTNIDTAWNISYGTLVLLSILFSFPDIFVNVAFLRLFLWVGRRTIPKDNHAEE